MMKRLGLLLTAVVLACAFPSAHGFDPKPGRYKGTLKVTTSFPGTDVSQSVTQKATARLQPNGRMLIALPNTLDGIEEIGDRAAFLFFNSPTDNGCLVKILKDNFISLPEVTSTRIRLVRSSTINTTDAGNSPISYDVTMELILTRFAK